MILERGSDKLKEFPSSMQGQFSQLGLSVKVDNSKLVILNDYLVCKSGEPLTANQAQMTVIYFNLNKFRNT